MRNRELAGSSGPAWTARTAHAGAPGYGEAITAGNDGGFYTVQERDKTPHSGTGAPIWSFSP